MVGELPDPGARRGAALRATATSDRSSARSRPRSPARSWRSCAASSDAGLPRTEVEPVAAALAVVREAVRDGLAGAAHDVSDGGLACALAEMAIAGGVGIEARPRSAGRAARRRPARRPCSARGPGASCVGRRTPATCSSAREPRAWTPCGSARRPATGSSCRPPSGPSRSCSRTPSAPGSLCRTACRRRRKPPEFGHRSLSSRAERAATLRLQAGSCPSLRSPEVETPPQMP